MLSTSSESLAATSPYALRAGPGPGRARASRASRLESPMGPGPAGWAGSAAPLKQALTRNLLPVESLYDDFLVEEDEQQADQSDSVAGARASPLSPTPPLSPPAPFPLPFAPLRLFWFPLDSSRSVDTGLTRWRLACRGCRPLSPLALL